MFDLQLAVRSWPELQLSAIEKPLRTRGGGEILGYEDKYVGYEGMTSAPASCQLISGPNSRSDSAL